MKWLEDTEGNNYLLLNEQEMPEPLIYETFEDTKYTYIIHATSYNGTGYPKIKDVRSYGFLYSKDQELLYSNLIETDERFIHIITSPAIEVRISKERPKITD